ncbi:MAG: cardiolipin synthase [Lachnospiraceae bacterium]
MENKTVKKAKKGLFSIIFSRTALLVILLLLQISGLIYAITMLSDYWFLLYGVFLVISAAVVIYIINGKGNADFKLTWILCILIFSIFGVAFYLFVKMQFGTRHIGQRLGTLRGETDMYMQQNPNIIERLRISKPANANLAYYMSHQLSFPVYQNTKVTYFPLGEDKYQSLLLDLEHAKKYIFMEYFIVAKGVMWEHILDILEQKAKTGVEVRFMYDGMCSVELLPYNYAKQIRKKGIKCKIFSPIRPILSTKQNNRDHRKICVIDGVTAYTGGINLADEYINEKERFGHWKDTAVRIKGDGVQSFTMMFLQMWNINERKPENYKAYLTPMATELRKEYGFVLPYGDSPHDNENVGEEVYFHILNHAKKYVHIMTPYLILDSEMISSLTFAAKCGVEVIIIMPHIPDKAYAFALAKTYYEELIIAGVQIYEYTKGFVHAKVFVSDDDTATVGTINLDYRSFYHHFECGAFIYNNPVVDKIEQDFQYTLKKCQKISLMEARNRKFTTKIYGEVLRLVAPLM